MQQDKLEEGKKREEWSELLKRNARLQEHVLRIDSGNEMQMMNPYLEAMVMVSAAKCLRPEFAPFFLSLSFAELGMDSEKSAAGFLGSSMNRLIDHVTDGLTSEVLFGKKADLAASMVLKKIIKFTFVLAVAGGKLLQEKVRGNEKEKETNELYIKLIFRLSSATDILKIALKELVLATGSAEKAAEDIAKSISSLAFLLMAYSAANKQNFHALLEILMPSFKEALKNAESALDNETNEMKAHLTSFKLALENENFEGFITAVLSSLEAIGISQTGFVEDIKSIQEMALRMQKAISEGLIDLAKNPTEISVVV